MRRIEALKHRLHDIVDPKLGGESWPEHTYLAITEYKLLYCPIPKVACTSFKSLCVTLSATKVPLGRGLHRRAHQAYSLSRMRRSEADRLLQGVDWFRFAFVRNPWDRLASAFCNKFVRAEALTAFAVAVTEEIAAFKGEAQGDERGISFRDFVEHVCRSPDDRLDEHWKPQYLFLGNNHFDFIGRFEALDEHFSRLATMRDLPVGTLPLTNSTPYAPAPSPEDDSACVADVSAAELSRLDALPDYRRFYTSDLIELVEGRYRQDVEWFGYRFDGDGQGEPILPAPASQ